MGKKRRFPTPRRKRAPKPVEFANKDRIRIFISYSRKNDDWMSAIFDELDQLGDIRIDIWMDEERIEAGDSIDESVKKGIECADLALLLISDAYVTSNYIKENEIKWINARGDSLRRLYVVIGAPGDGAKNTPTDGSVNQTEVEKFLRQNKLDGKLSLIDTAKPLNLKYSEEEKERVREIVEKIQEATDPRYAILHKRLKRNYEILGRVADGDSAYIYRAKQASTNDDVAIKMLKDPRDASWFKGLMINARTVSDVSNIIPIIDHAFRTTISYCVLKYVEGCTLQAFVRNNQPISVDFATTVIEKIGNALLRVRMHKTFSRVFLKVWPNNILVETATKEPYLSLAVRPANQRGRAYWRTLFSRLGNALAPQDIDDFAYAVPEFIAPQRREPHPSKFDQYLLGLLGYQMLTGKLPYQDGQDARGRVRERQAEREQAAWDRFVEERLVSLDCHEGTPRPFNLAVPIINRMMDIEPANRFDDVSQALEAIRFPEQYVLSVVKESFHRCTEDEAKSDHFMSSFYAEFLGRSREVRRVFRESGFSVRGTRKNDKWRKQQAMLKHAITLLLHFFEHHARGDTLEPNILSFYREKHLSLDLSETDYEHFVDALIDTVRTHDAAWTTSPQGRYWEEMWRRVTEPGVKYMQKRSGYDRR